MKKTFFAITLLFCVVFLLVGCASTKGTNLYEDTTTEVEKSESAALAEINAKLNAIETSSKTPLFQFQNQVILIG